MKATNIQIIEYVLRPPEIEFKITLVCDVEVHFG